MVGLLFNKLIKIAYVFLHLSNYLLWNCTNEIIAELSTIL